MRNIRRWLAAIPGIVLLLIGQSALAQDTCPANVILALARAAAVCQNLDRNTACYGNGAAEAVLTDPALSFSLPGDRVPTAAIQSISVSSPDEWSAVTIATQANLAETDQRSVTILVYGNASLTNTVPPVPTLLATARGTVNIRATPDSQGEIVERIGINSSLTLTGRSEDNVWLRVAVPNTNVTGWASPDILSVSGDLSSLNIVTPDTPLQRPFETLIIDTAHDDALCEGAPESGILIQTPPELARLGINGAAIELNGTAYLQISAQNTLDIAILNGIAVVQAGGVQAIIPQGAATQLSLDSDRMVTGAPSSAAAYIMSELPALAVNTLPTRFQIAQPASADQIAAAIADFTAPPPPEVTPVVVETCRFTVRTADHVRRGAGSQYESVDVLEEGARVYPVGRAIGDDGAEWIELRGGTWIRASAIQASETCDPLPQAEYIAQPSSNTLTLETCATSNGPIRTGQRVLIEFIPLPRETLGESQIITRVDRGRITVNGRRLHVRVSDPIKLAEFRYIRTFSATWTARPGTWRIVGSHLSYQMICNVNVPVDAARP